MTHCSLMVQLERVANVITPWLCNADWVQATGETCLDLPDNIAGMITLGGCSDMGWYFVLHTICLYFLIYVLTFARQVQVVSKRQN